MENTLGFGLDLAPATGDPLLLLLAAAALAAWLTDSAEIFAIVLFFGAFVLFT